MSHNRAAELQDAVGVPVINPLQVTLHMAELLVASGVRRRGGP
jgi:hypothetical protein